MKATVKKLFKQSLIRKMGCALLPCLLFASAPLYAAAPSFLSLKNRTDCFCPDKGGAPCKLEKTSAYDVYTFDQKGFYSKIDKLTTGDAPLFKDEDDTAVVVLGKSRDDQLWTPMSPKNKGFRYIIATPNGPTVFSLPEACGGPGAAKQ